MADRIDTILAAARAALEDDACRCGGEFSRVHNLSRGCPKHDNQAGAHGPVILRRSTREPMLARALVEMLTATCTRTLNGETPEDVARHIEQRMGASPQWRRALAAALWRADDI